MAIEEVPDNAAVLKQLESAAKANGWDLDPGGKVVSITTKHFYVEYFAWKSELTVMMSDPLKNKRVPKTGGEFGSDLVTTIREPDPTKAAAAQAFFTSLPELIPGTQTERGGCTFQIVPLAQLNRLLGQIVTIEKFDATELAEKIRVIAVQDLQKLFQEGNDPVHPQADA